MHRGLREVALIACSAVALYLFLALLSYNSADPAWSHAGAGGKVTNLGGIVGAWFADIFYYLFGYFAFLFPAMVALSGVLVFRGRNASAPQKKDPALLAARIGGFVLTLIGGTSLAALHFHSGALPAHAGGVLGDVVGHALVGVFSFLGATLLLLAVFLTGVTLATHFSWLWAMDALGRATLGLFEWSRDKLIEWRDEWAGRRARVVREEAVRDDQQKIKKRKAPKIEPVAKRAEPSARVEREKQIPLFTPPVNAALPALALLDPAEPPKNVVSKSALEAVSRQVELKLADFGVEVEVVEVHPGPVVTRYELQPAAGVKVSQISNLAKDLARSLSVKSVRVVEVIPGKSTVGLEIPNEHREIVRLSEVLSSGVYDESKSPLTLALGKDIGGNPVAADLARMPHLLVAGTTGSGKSVAVNAMVLSILYKSTPQDVRLIMIDPKMLELSVYEGIPHLLAPVVTDMKEASNALRWSCVEMDRRYRLMAALGVRNITGYNKKVHDADEAGQPIVDPTFKPNDPAIPPRHLEHLPYIVVIVDELADMMMVTGKKCEELIARLAQKARAAGIHLVLATQRPSVDVITGLIKANIPTRIAFQVSSKIDSRTILDQMGAEALLGHGDMLYLPPGTGLPMRVHGAFVADHEVHKVVSKLKENYTPQYNDEILNGTPEGDAVLPGEKPPEGEADELYDEAVAFVTQARRVSISSVQRRFKVGYNRAARLVEDMERAGVVGPIESNGAREVLAPPPPDVD
jgi:S-DNA-T family DNA segregation ATPase FtsK/SpoIIIE